MIYDVQPKAYINWFYSIRLENKLLISIAIKLKMPKIWYASWNALSVLLQLA